MTTPNQSDNILEPPSGSDLVGLLGQGAYTISDSGTYGQNVTDDYVNNLVYGPLAPSNVAANSSSLTDVISVMSNLLTGIPVSTLKYLQPFIPGATDADFADSATASAFITNTFVPKMVVDTTNWVTRFVQDIEVLFDFFHTTYPAGSPTDTPTTTVGGKMTWYAAWADFLELVGLTSGTTPTSPAPTVGTSITSATDWVTRLMQDLEILFDVFHLTYNAGTSTDPPGTLGVGGAGAGKPTWYSAWNDVLQLIGLATGTTPTTPAPTIGTAINTAGTTANTASAWATRLTNDLLITSDVFHVVYNTGSPTDPPGTLGVGGVGPGKPTWYSAWNDLKALTGTVNGASAPTDAAPAVASAITTAQSTATSAASTASSAATAASTAQSAATTAGTAAGTAQTTANTAASWGARLTNDLIITSDVFHLTYNVGTVTDAPGTLWTGGGVGNGKPTWYSAWNDLLALCGVVNSVTPPTDPAPAIADAVTTAQTSAVAANANASSALSQLTSIPQQTVTPNLTAGASSVTIDNAGSGGSATNSSGSVSTPLSCTGTQTVGASASVMIAAATFSLVGSGSVGNAQISIGGQQMQNLGTVQLSSVTEFVEFFILWNPPVGTSQTVTATAYGLLGAGVGSVSFESASYNGATRASTLITSSGTGTSLSLSVPAAIAGTMAVAAFSAGDVTTKANTALSSYTKTQRGNVTAQVNSTQYGYQSLAFGDSVGGSGGVTFGATGADSFAVWAGVGIVLSATSVIGSGLRQSKNATTTVITSGGNQSLGPFFTTTQYCTPDLSISGTTGAATVSIAGWYMVTISVLEASVITVHQARPLLYQNGAVVQQGGTMYVTTSASNTWLMQSTFTVYCNAGDTIQPGVWYSISANAPTGESTGTCSYWEVALVNRSLL